MFKPDDAFKKAAASLARMDSKGLKMALESVKEAQLLAIQCHKKDVAIEMSYMRAEIVKIMATQIHKTDGSALGATVKEAHARIDKETAEEVEALEAL